MFQDAFINTMGHEGYYVNDPTDKGGETYRGISRVNNAEWPGWLIIDKEKQNFRNRTIPRHTRIHNSKLDQLVEDLYYAKYWKKILLDELCAVSANHELLCHLLFDSYVQHGGYAIAFLQEACNELMPAGADALKVDMGMGGKTLSKAAILDGGRLHDLVLEKRRAFLMRWLSKPGNSKYLDGILDRVQSFPVLNP